MFHTFIFIAARHIRVPCLLFFGVALVCNALIIACSSAAYFSMHFAVCQAARMFHCGCCFVVFSFVFVFVDEPTLE